MSYFYFREDILSDTSTKVETTAEDLLDQINQADGNIYALSHLPGNFINWAQKLFTNDGSLSLILICIL